MKKGGQGTELDSKIMLDREHVGTGSGLMWLHDGKAWQRHELGNTSRNGAVGAEKQYDTSKMSRQLRGAGG